MGRWNVPGQIESERTLSSFLPHRHGTFETETEIISNNCGMKSTIFSKTGQPQISDFRKVFFPPVFTQAVIESVGRGTLARGMLVQNVLNRYYNKAFWTPGFAGVTFHWSFSATC
jgi:hypothetical protein